MRLQLLRWLSFSALSLLSQGRRSPRDVTIPSPADSDQQYSPSTASVSSNPWFFRFPPWYLPGNPDPLNGFSDEAKSQTGAAGFTMVDDGDILVIDDIDNRDKLGRLSTVRVPGNSAFRDEVLQTVLHVKSGKSQTPSSSNKAVTPWLVPQSVPLPPLPPPAPTQPLTLHGPQDSNHLVTSRPLELDNHFTSFSPYQSSIISPDGGNFQYSGNLVSETSPGDLYNGGFYPSLPDLTRTPRPFVTTQGYSKVSNGDFRPSKLLSVTRLTSDRPKVRDVGEKTLWSRHDKHTSQHVNLDNNYLRGQQAELLKISNKVQSTNSPQFHDQENPLWLPGLLPGLLPLPFLHHGIHQPSAEQLKQPHNYQRGGRHTQTNILEEKLQQQQYQEYHGGYDTNVPSHSGPTSIQDIINGDYDTAQHLYQRGKNVRTRKTKGSVDGENERWHWPMN